MPLMRRQPWSRKANHLNLFKQEPQVCTVISWSENLNCGLDFTLNRVTISELVVCGQSHQKLPSGKDRASVHMPEVSVVYPRMECLVCSGQYWYLMSPWLEYDVVRHDIHHRVARKSASLPTTFTSHSPSNPGSRVLPVRSCCMAACLRSRFLAISRSRPSSRASTSLKAVTITHVVRQ